MNAVVHSSGPAAKHLNQAKSRRVSTLGHSVLLGPSYANVEERLPTSTSLKEWKERRRRKQSRLKGFGTKKIYIWGSEILVYMIIIIECGNKSKQTEQKLGFNTGILQGCHRAPA